MVLSMGAMTAFADGANVAKTLDGSVKIEGLDEGDVVKFYKLVGWNQDSGWVLDDTFSALEGTNKNGTGYDSDGVVVGWTTSDTTALMNDVLKYIAGIPATVTSSVDSNSGNTTYTTQDAVLGRINSELAAKIAAVVTGTTADHEETVATDENFVLWEEVKEGEDVTKEAPDAGLYVALVTPKNAGTMYNPIFVANDYDDTNAAGYSNVQSAVLDPERSYSDSAMAKKTNIDVKKSIEEDEVTVTGGTVSGSTDDLQAGSTGEGNTATSVDAGEISKFKVLTTIPEYNDLYTSASFKISDTLTGLALVIDNDHPFIIKAGNHTPAEGSEYALTAISGNDGKDTAATARYSNTAANSGTSYVVDFTSAYIL